MEIPTAAIHTLPTTTDLSQADIQSLISSFEQEKFLRIKLTASKGYKDELLSFASLFGTILPHDRADAHGIAPITPMEGFADYLGTTSAPHYPHTDGTFNKEAPATAILYCEHQAQEGGVSHVISGRAAHQYLETIDPEGLRALYTPDAMTVTRASTSATRPIFSTHGAYTRIAFRYDTVAKIEVKPEAKRAFELLRGFVRDPENIIEFQMNPQELFIVDNTAVLHGRTAFSSADYRLLYRVNTNSASPYGVNYGFLL